MDSFNTWGSSPSLYCDIMEAPLLSMILPFLEEPPGTCSPRALVKRIYLITNSYSVDHPVVDESTESSRDAIIGNGPLQCSTGLPF